MKPNERLRKARETNGKTEAEMEKIIGPNAPTYYDLEAYEDELPMTMTLNELHRLCAFLGITIRILFEAEGKQLLSFADLAEVVRNYLAGRSLSIEQFEELAGWELRGLLDNPDAAWEWNVECLRDVCQTVSRDWLDVLPE
jgi:transcriptional regulator with XRE-family HTH domain